MKTVLRICADQPLLTSLHSARATQQITDLVFDQVHPGLILHWYLGDQQQQQAAAEAGAFFSVNNAMPDATLALATLPQHQVLPETDSMRPGRRSRRPGDTGALLSRLARLWGTTPEQARHRCWV